ncbi:MAG: hypothetical protein RLZZ31_590, partial [Actinomycetota bacterium]
GPKVDNHLLVIAGVGTIGSTTIAMHFGDSYVSGTVILLISLLLVVSYFSYLESRKSIIRLFMTAIGFCLLTLFITYQLALVVCVAPFFFAFIPKARSLKDFIHQSLERGVFVGLGIAISAVVWEIFGSLLGINGVVGNSISSLVNATNDMGDLHDKTISWLAYKPDLAFPFVLTALAILIMAIPDFSRRFERSAFRFSSVSLICAVATLTWLEVSPRVAQGLQLEMQHYYGWLWPFALFFLCLVLHTVGKKIAPRFNYLLLAGTLLLLIVVNLNARSDFQFYVPRIVFNTFTALLVVGLAAILLIRLLSESSDDRSKTIWHSLIILLLPLFLFLPETTSSTIPLRPVYKFEYQLIGPGPARNRPAGEAVAVRSLNYATDRVSLETQAFTEIISFVRNTSLVIVSNPYANAAIDSTVAMFIVPPNRSIVWKDAQQSPSEVRRALENPEKKKASVVVFANDLVTAEDRFNSLAIPEPTVERYVCGHRSSSAGSIAYCAAVLTDG